MQKRWSKAEIAYLKRHAEKRSAEELAERFKVDVETVEAQLAKLAAASKTRTVAEDPTLADYDKALRLMHQSKWQKAADLFDKIVRQTDSPHVGDRARQNSLACKQRLEKDAVPKDPYLRAVIEKNEGHLDVALELCKKHGQLDKDERFAYLAASVEALAGSEEEAIRFLETAIRLEPKNRVHAYHDPDFKGLRASEAFSELIAEAASS